MSFEAFLKARDFLFERGADYETAYRDFQWPTLDKFNWALDYFDDYAYSNERIALWLVDDEGEIKLSYDALRRRSNQAARFLRSQGVKRGDVLLMMVENVAPLWEIMLASIKLGAIMIPTTTLLSRADLQDRLVRAKATHLISSATEKFTQIGLDLRRIVVGEPQEGWIHYDEAYGHSEEFVPDGETQATDPLLYYFTSGTTSKPKLVLHTHQSYPVGALSTLYWMGLQPDDIHYNISSPGWAKHAWSNFFAPFNAGCTVFLHRAPRFHAPTVLKLIAEKGVTSLCAPPTVWRMFIQEDLKSYDVKLRSLVGAGEPLNPEVISRVEEAWGLTIRDGYGQTETTAVIANSPEQAVKSGSMGRPLPGYQVVLLDIVSGEETAQEGEISLVLEPRPVGLMERYEGDPVRTEKAMGGKYYRTGDVAQRDADGYYIYVGRADDVFKSSDYRLSPFELESAMMEHHGVAEVAVVPSPDPVKLSVPKAYIVLTKEHEPNAQMALELFKFSREHMAPYKRIRRLQFMELPKTVSGKIRRVDLRKHATSERPEGEFREEDFPELKRS